MANFFQISPRSYYRKSGRVTYRVTKHVCHMPTLCLLYIKIYTIFVLRFEKVSHNTLARKGFT
jgi:hypothetical protein